jgi:hypothetical protein
VFPLPSVSSTAPFVPYSLPQACYYGKHYVAILQEQPSGDWIMYDDASVRSLGKDWNEVVTLCIKGNWQPLLLFYERQQPA